MELLSIIIPAYKGKFLEESLRSIVKQTDQRFRVYVGDDASPEGLEEIVWRSGLCPNRLVYHRFETNLGKDSLVKHWERCIALSKEPWIWLFSDDDLMEPSCVSSFFQTLEETNHKYDLYRFDTVIINEKDQIISMNPPHPQRESWNEYLFFFLNNWRLSNQQELIFRRSAFEKIGGFIDFPLAWWSDIAFTIACSIRTGIAKIEGSRLLMRKSNINISSMDAPKIYQLKLMALLQFTKWLVKFIESQTYEGFPDNIILKQLIKKHFFWRLRVRNQFYGPSYWKIILPLLKELFGISPVEGFFRLLHLNILFLVENIPRRLLTRFL